MSNLPNKLYAGSKNSAEFRSAHASNSNKVQQVNIDDERKLQALLEKEDINEHADEENKASSKEHTQEHIPGNAHSPYFTIESHKPEFTLGLNARLNDQIGSSSLTKLADTVKPNVQSSTDFLINKIALHVTSDLKNSIKNSTINITLPPQHLNGGNIILTRDNTGAMNISFMVTSVSIANQLQLQLPMLKRELDRKLPTTKMSFNIKQETKSQFYAQPNVMRQASSSDSELEQAL